MKLHRGGINHSYLEITGKELLIGAAVAALVVVMVILGFKLSDNGSLVYDGPATYESQEQAWPEYGCFAVPDISEDPVCGPFAQVRTGSHTELAFGEEYLVEVHELADSKYSSGEPVYMFIVSSSE
ncbi:hypothetical protein [Glycomyces rhizosphaerae]|uniref:Integron gene cassette protein n=1 Tax=Glycomyces rhizosphaerae TaxID=2054422 RepID=A0ABV7PWL2_9ACTN